MTASPAPIFLSNMSRPDIIYVHTNVDTTYNISLKAIIDIALTSGYLSSEESFWPKSVKRSEYNENRQNIYRLGMIIRTERSMQISIQSILFFFSAINQASTSLSYSFFKTIDAMSELKVIMAMSPNWRNESHIIAHLMGIQPIHSTFLNYISTDS